MTIKKAVGVLAVSCIIILSSCNSSNQGKGAEHNTPLQMQSR